VLKLLFVFALASTLSAQTTWNGLRFGMTAGDAKAYMKSQGFDVGAVGEDEKHQTATPDYELQLPNLTVTFPFKPEFNFDSTGLSVITLGLNGPKWLERIANNMFVAVTLAAKDIHDALVTKYGQPVSMDGPCNNVTVSMLLNNRRDTTCEAKWKGDSQMISVYWLYYRSPEKFSYFLQYQPQSNGL
jgi:hypothetical protein